MHSYRQNTSFIVHQEDRTSADESAEIPLSDVLTPRETEIARLAARGLTNKEIALTLDISHWTVATHLRRVFDKTNVNRRAALGHALTETLSA